METGPKKSIFIAPAPHGWNFIQSSDSNGTWNVRSLRSLDEAVPLLKPEDEFVLGLPVSSVLAQRLHLPKAEPGEFEAMVRLQIEKALPFAPDEVTADFEVIEHGEDGSVVSAVAVRNDHLTEMAKPLLDRGCIPRQVTVYAGQRAATHAPEGNALLIYPEGEKLVSAVTENGKLSLTRTFEGAEAQHLEAELPQLTLNAELQGINATFPKLLLDESCSDLRDTIEGLLESTPELVGVETPPATVKLNLLPDAWRHRRVQLARRQDWIKRLIWAGGIYVGAFVLLLVALAYYRIQVGRLDRAIARDEPSVQFVRNAEANWKALAPAIDARHYPVEILLHLFENLPAKQEVRITTYTQSARQISVDGEADSAQLAYDFAEKVKKDPGLRIFQFNMADPKIMPNNHAQFRLEGRPR